MILGHYIDNQGIHADPKKIQKIQEWATLTTEKSIQHNATTLLIIKNSSLLLTPSALFTHYFLVSNSLLSLITKPSNTSLKNLLLLLHLTKSVGWMKSLCSTLIFNTFPERPISSQIPYQESRKTSLLQAIQIRTKWIL